MRQIIFEDNQLHSTYSDGTFTPQQIFDYNQFHDRLDLTITDHVDKNTDWFEKYVDDISALRKNYPDFSIKIGCEVKIIDEQGELNTTDEILNQAEVVIGTVHHFPGIKSLTIEELIEKEFILTKLLAENKKIHILGHPFSMVKRFYNADVPEAYVREVYKRCVINGIKLEYNAKNCPPSVRRLVVAEIAQGSIANFSFGSDMHTDLTELGNSAFDATEPVTVLVTGAGAGVGQSIIKALKLSSIKTNIIAADCDHRGAGLYRANRACLIPHSNEADYIKKIIELCQQEKVGIVCIGTDVELGVIASHKEKIESETAARVIISGSKAVEIANDKWLTYQFLKSHQLPCPNTWTVEQINQATLPAVVKPRVGARSIDVRLVMTTQELAQAVAAVKNPIIQEYLANDDQEYTCGGFFFEGKCYGVTTAQRWLRAGDTYKARFYHDPELEQFIEQVGLLLNVNGPCNFQLRKTNGGPKIFEINCRFSGTTGAASFLGFNVINALIQKIIFNRPLKKLAGRETLMLRYWNEVFVGLDDAENLKINHELPAPDGQLNIF